MGDWQQEFEYRAACGDLDREAAPELAHAAYRQALQRVDDARGRSRGPADRIAYQAVSDRIAGKLIRLLVDRQSVREAFDLVERTRGRTFTEQTALGMLPAPPTLSAEERAREDGVLAALRELERAPEYSAAADRRYADVRGRLTDLWQDWSTSADEDVRAYAGRRRTPLATFADLAKHLSRQTRRLVVAAFHADRERTTVFVVAPGGRHQRPLQLAVAQVPRDRHRLLRERLDPRVPHARGDVRGGT